jgi:hypothetical protein
MTPESIPYSGFTINPSTFQIYKNGKEVFAASWQRSITIEHAKKLIDDSEKARLAPSLSNYSPMFLLDEDEAMQADRDREQQRVEQYYELLNEQIWQ